MWRWVVSAVLMGCGGTKLLSISDSDSVDTAATSGPGVDTDTHDSDTDTHTEPDTGTLDTSGGPTTSAGPCDYIVGTGGALSTEVSFMQELETDGRVRWVDRANTSTGRPGGINNKGVLTRERQPKLSVARVAANYKAA